MSIIWQNDSYIASDDIEYGHGNRIPLWLFGFLRRSWSQYPTNRKTYMPQLLYYL